MMDSNHRILPWVPHSIVGFPSRPRTPSMAKTLRFEGFGKLPSDLRRKIWFYSLPGSQTIPLSLQVRETLDNGQRILEWTHDPCLLVPLNLPPLLFVNHEARDIVLEHYHKLPFPVTPNTYYSRSSKAKCVYFNYATDAFAILSEHLQHLFHSAAGNFYMLDSQFTQLFPNVPMNVKRFTTCHTSIKYHIEMRGDPPEFPLTEKVQRVQNWLFIGAKLKRIKDNYSRGHAVWKSPLPLQFKGLCHTGIDTNEEAFLQLTKSTPHTPKFHLFPNLPFELRRQIWKYLLPPPTHINLSLHPQIHVDLLPYFRSLLSTPESEREALPPQDLLFWPDPRFNPTLLLVNRETHSLFLESYTWIPLQSAHVPGCNPPEAGVYFDKLRDCFLLRKRNMCYVFAEGLEDRFTGLPLSIKRMEIRDFVEICVASGYPVFSAAGGEKKGENLLEGLVENDWKDWSG